MQFLIHGLKAIGTFIGVIIAICLSFIFVFGLCSLMQYLFTSFYTGTKGFEISSYTYDKNVLHFQLKNSETNYQLKLPDYAVIQKGDKLSIIFMPEYTTPEREPALGMMNPKIIHIKHHQAKTVDLYVNNVFAYGLNDNVELKYFEVDKKTGFLVEKIF